MSPAPAPAINPWWTSSAVMFATLMVYLDTTVVNLSLPYIAGSLSASINESTWALTSYLAANAVVLPISGWLANQLGRKRLLIAALVSFVGSSLLCGLAPNIEFLVLCRVLQGLTGGVMQPLSQAIMLESFEPHERGRAMGLWSLGIIAAPILGPLLGGWLTETYSWRWVFFINVPFGVVAYFLVQWFVLDPDYVRRRPGPVDYRSLGLLALGVGSLQVLLDRGQDEDWFDSRLIVALAIVGSFSVLAFIYSSLKSKAPLVDLTVYRDRTFAIGSVLSALIGFLLYGSIVLLPLMLQTLLRYPPLDAGLTIAQRGLGAMLAFPIVGALTDRFDPRKLLFCGLLLGAFTMFWFSRLSADLAAVDLFWPQFLQGIALGLLFIPMTTITMTSIPLAKMGNATSLFNVSRNFGSSAGIAITATYLQRSFEHNRTVLANAVAFNSPVATARLDALQGGFEARGADAWTASQQALQALAATVDRQASTLSFLHTFQFFAMIFIAMLPLAFLLRRPDRYRPGS